MDLISLDNLRLMLNISDSVTEKDERLQWMITSVSALIEAFCNRQFAAADYTEYYDGDCSDVLVLANTPVNSIASINDDVSRQFGSATLVDPANYVLTKEGIICMLPGNYFTYGIQNIKVVYNAGYAAVPADLQLVAGEVIMKKFKAYSAGAVGQSSVAAGGVSTSFSLDDLSKEHREILAAKYRT